MKRFSLSPSPSLLLWLCLSLSLLGSVEFSDARGVWGNEPINAIPSTPKESLDAHESVALPNSVLLSNCTGGQLDVCGVCNGTTVDPADCVRGCDGVFSSGLVYDQCGICNGTNSTCVCPTKRFLGWFMLAVTLLSAPLFMYAIMRLWVYTVETEPGWLVNHFNFDVLSGKGAFRAKIAQDARHNAWINTFFFTVIVAIVTALRFVADWTSSESVVCHRIELDTVYLSMFDALLALGAVVCAARYFVAMRRPEGGASSNGGDYY